jgi:hypothetical protein
VINHETKKAMIEMAHKLKSEGNRNPGYMKKIVFSQIPFELF